MELTIYRTTEFPLASADQFDLEVLKVDSNQRSGPGYFTMQVRRIIASEWTSARWENGKWDRRLRVEGRRYKPDGTLGSPPATGDIRASDLPPDIWVAIRDDVPAELHPGGER